MQHLKPSIQTLLDTQVPDALAIPLLQEIKQSCKKQNIRIVVLDDDPTGTQTVHDIPVITNWDEELILKTLDDSPQGFFILTNTRSLPETEAILINKEIAARLKKAAAKIHCGIIIISRGDSTLRGHYPAEVFALERGWEKSYSGYVLMPYFREGNRYTINNIHYLLENKQLVPVADTPFAKDPVFGYSSSDLTYYIEEKTNKTVHHEEVQAITLEQLRAGITETGTELDKLREGQHVIINATCAYHAAVFALSLLRQWEKGKKYLVRCSASLVQSLFGIHDLKMLSVPALQTGSSTGGLIIVGSFVAKTTEQLAHLIVNTAIFPVEVNAEYAAKNETGEYATKIAALITGNLSNGKSVVLYTSREIITGNSTGSGLQIGSKIAEALVSIVQKINCRPRFIVAKGGITSSDIATRALHIRKAMVGGQLLPGIPVWIQGEEAKFPGMPYIIFPGNVGTPDYMTILYRKITAQDKYV